MAEEKPTINLKVLSPSTEVEGGVNLTDLPASTTVKELRSRIQDAVPSKPAPERMRLIYRGRVVANEGDTLETVFGAENIRESKDQSLHLVIRELPQSAGPSDSTAPRSSTAPPNSFRPSPTAAAIPANPLQTNPFRTLPQPRPNSQPQIPQPHHHHHPHNHPRIHHHHHLPPPVDMLPLLPQPLQQQLAQAMAEGQPTDEQGRERTPAPADGAQAPPPGTAPSPPTGLPNLPGHGSQPVRQEGIGPNGARWSVTYNQVHLPARPQQPNPLSPPPHGIGFGLPSFPRGPLPPNDAIQNLIPRLTTSLQAARQEMNNVNTLMQTPDGQNAFATPSSALTDPPVWRIVRIRQHLQNLTRNLDLVERGLTVLIMDPSSLQNAEVRQLRRDVNQLRQEARELNGILDRLQGSPTQPPTGPFSSAAPGASILTPAIPTTSHPQAQNSAQTMPTDAPAELFLVSSPQGPVGILFDQQATYTTGPMASTLPFQTFRDQFTSNQQILARMGQQMAQSSNRLHHRPTNAQPTHVQQAAAGVQVQDQNQNQNQNQNQAQNQAQNQNQNVNANANADPRPENEHEINIGAHIWLIFKLAIFVYFFSGGGGLYRSLMLGTVAILMYLTQIGAFGAHYDLLRRHFEALLPIGALAERAAQPPAHQQHQRAANMTPEEAARRLLQQRQNQRFGWVGDAMRSVERAFALFVASLFPGVGERMVHAQEERARLERVAAEEERQRIEEERRREEEGRAQLDKKDEKDGEPGPGPSSSAKGKERADEVETGEASGS